MQAASLAERLLRLALGRERASAAVGDLVEISRDKGSVWFWLAVIGCLLRAAWRPIVGGVVLFFVAMRMLDVFSVAAVSIYTKHLPTRMWLPYMHSLCGIGAVMCGAGMYSVIRYGFTDKFTQFAAAFSVLSSVVIFAWWFPGVLPSAAVVLLMLSAYFFSRSKGRLALLTALATVAASIFTFFLLCFADSLYENHVLHGRPAGDAELRQHPMLNVLAIMIFITTAAVTAFTCSRMHAILARRSTGTPPSETIGT